MTKQIFKTSLNFQEVDAGTLEDKVLVRSVDGDVKEVSSDSFRAGSEIGELSEGNVIDFKNITGKIYNKNNPVAGNITLDFTEANIGAVSCIFHKSSSIPIVNNGVFFSSGKYNVNQTNVLWFTFIDNNNVIMSIQNMTALDIPENFSYTVLSSTSVKFTWTNTGTAVLEKSNNSNFSEAVTIYNGDLHEYTDNVAPGIYYYRLKSVANGSLDSPYINLLVSTYTSTNLTFVSGTKNLLTNPSGNIWSTSSVNPYESYGNSDFKFPANTLSWVQINTPNIALEGSIVGLATSNVAGNFSVTKFAVQTATGGNSIAKFLNGVYMSGDIANGYYVGANAKLRLLREANGTCKVYKSLDGLTYELVYTFTELYTGELWIILNPKDSGAQINNPVGFNMINK